MSIIRGVLYITNKLQMQSSSLFVIITTLVYVRVSRFKNSHNVLARVQVKYSI